MRRKTISIAKSPRRNIVFLYSIWSGETISVAEYQTRVKLDKKLPEVNFEGIPLSAVLDYVRDLSGLNLLIDARTLEAAGIERLMRNNPRKLSAVDIEKIYRTAY